MATLPGVWDNLLPQCPHRCGSTTSVALTSAARSLLAGQSVGSRWFGGVPRVPLAQSQLPFQIGDLLLGIGDLLLAFGQLIAEPLHLSLL
jgi:hypothetical protein